MAHPNGWATRHYSRGFFGWQSPSWGSSSIRGRVASGDYSPKAPADPDERDYRIRLFGARFRYVTGEEMCGWGSG